MTELSPTKIELLDLMAEGYTNQVIADMMDLGVGTVKVYISQLSKHITKRDKDKSVRFQLSEWWRAHRVEYVD